MSFPVASSREASFREVVASLYFDAEAFRAAHDRHVAYHERKVAEALAEQRRQAMNPEPPI